MAAAPIKKALMNSPERLVQESLEGLLECVPHLRRLEGFPDVKVMVDGGRDPSQVAVICGGGSGHEPSQAGFIGRGMLTAAVCGDTFAAPPAEAVLAAIHATAGPAGALLVITNYTGDRICFGSAAEEAKAAGLALNFAVVGEDTAIARPGLAGRRGLAGTALVNKVAGAAAAAGRSLEEVTAAARGAAGAMGTLGVALSACTLPGAPLSARLAPEDIEVGMGAHGEPGYSTRRWQPLRELVPSMLAHILAYGGDAAGGRGGGSGGGGGDGPGEEVAADSEDFGAAVAHRELNSGKPLVLLVNDFGATSGLEMFAVVRESLAWLRAQGVPVVRVLVGPFLTSLSMEGCSLTLMACDEDRLALLDAPTSAPGWTAFRSAVVPEGPPPSLPLPPAVLELRRRRAELLAGRPLAGASAGGAATEAAVRAAAAALRGARARLNELDAKAGDGDTGDTCATVGAALLAAEEGAFASDSAADTLRALAAVVRGAAGGCHGGFYAMGLTAAAAALPHGAGCDVATWAAAAAAGAAAVARYGSAAQPTRAGTRTLLDALLPAADALAAAAAAGKGGAEAAAAAAAAAAAGAESTKGMAAAAGRASYLRGGALADADPGAVAVSVWLAAVADALRAPARQQA